MIDAPMRLPASATLNDCAALVAAMPEIIAARAGVLRLDASGVRRFDSATISLLLQAQRLAQRAGREFELVGAPPGLLALARLYGVDSLLEMSSLPTQRSAYV